MKKMASGITDGDQIIVESDHVFGDSVSEVTDDIPQCFKDPRKDVFVPCVKGQLRDHMDLHDCG